MRILFFSKNGMAMDIARRMIAEGNEVKLYIDQRSGRECFDGMVPKVKNWREELPWVGKNGLIVFDDSGYGKIQDGLRRRGFLVVGGCAGADKLELDREYGQKVFRERGLLTAELRDFSSAQDAIQFIIDNPKQWVLKRGGSVSKQFYYVGQESDGSDVIDFLKKSENVKTDSKHKLTLHERIIGVEFGIGRYFNGSNWVGPIEFNVEHPRLYPGGLGPITNEMGTLAWYSSKEKSRFYQETLAKMTEHLRGINFKGDFALNCIINENGAYVLEATPRFGSPIVHLQSRLQISSWADFLLAIAKGEDFKMQWRKGYGIVVLIATPPFPYTMKKSIRSSYGVRFNLNALSEEDLSKISFEEVKLVEPGVYSIADNYGYIAYVSAVHKTIQGAQKSAYQTIDKFKIPRMFYRNDIGNDFIKRDRAILKKLGYI